MKQFFDYNSSKEERNNVDIMIQGRVMLNIVTNPESDHIKKLCGKFDNWLADKKKKDDSSMS